MKEAGSVEEDQSFFGTDDADVREGGHETDLGIEFFEAHQSLPRMCMLPRKLPLPCPLGEIQNLSHALVLRCFLPRWKAQC